MLIRMRILLGVGIVWASIAWVQGQAPLVSPSEFEPAEIDGYIVRSGTGEPLAKARVLLRPTEGREPVFGSVTDASGRFVLGNIEPNSYRLHVERDGYVSQQYGQVSPNRPGTVLVLAPGQRVRDVVVSLVPTGTISGRVYDEDREPLVGASVRAFRYDYRDGERVLVPVRETETNDLGEYRLYWLAPGEYYVSATFQSRFRAAAALREAVVRGDPRVAPGFQQPLVAQPDQSDEIYVDTYFPGTNDPQGASPLTLAAASEVRAVDFTVLPTRAVTLRGRVVGPFSEIDGLSPTVAIVARGTNATASRPPFRRGGRGGVNPDGTFELGGVAPGSYTLVALLGSRQGRGGGRAVMAGFLDVEVTAEGMDGLIVAVQPSVSLAGHVLVDQSASRIDLSRLRVRMEPDGGLPIGNQNARVEPDGTFQIDNVNQMLHRVTLTGLPEDAYVASAQVGGRDVLSGGVLVTADTGPIEFWVSGAGGTLEGTVQIQAGQMYTGAQVVLIPDNSRRFDLYQVASADQYGRFSMRGIAPGSYRIFAWEDAPDGAYQDPEFVGRFEDFGARVNIAQAGRSEIQPRLIPAGQ
jgi:hypothetical protein